MQYMENQSIFVERLKEYIEEHNLNATILAKQIGCSRVTISNILNKAHVPSSEVFYALIEYFHCSADYLLGFIEFPRDTKLAPVQPFDICLRKCLKENNKNEANLRNDLKISSSLTYRWLHGKAKPTVESLIKLKKFFGCSIDYLLGREK